MKGIVFNLLEEVLTSEFGADAWLELIEASDVSGVYTSVGSYPDEELYKLVEFTARALNQTPDTVLKFFGRKAMPLLAVRYQALFAAHTAARSFILSVNDIIHPEVRKLYAGAGCPHFHFQHGANGRLLIGYSSPRNLCQLADGFINGAGDYFGEDIDVTHEMCMKEGDPTCRLALEWAA